MREQFIPYEEALALKKLGFNEECFGFYRKNKKLNLNTAPSKEIRNFWVDIDIKLYSKGDTYATAEGPMLESIAGTAAPTWRQAFNWFRKKGINSTIVFEEDVEDENGQFHHGFEIRNFKTMTISDNGDKLYYEHEKAELACLKKLIEILNK